MWRELIRVAAGVMVATGVSVAASVWLNQPFWFALPAGTIAGTLVAAVAIAIDRRK
jgi:hypothetical protein